MRSFFVMNKTSLASEIHLLSQLEYIFKTQDESCQDETYLFPLLLSFPVVPNHIGEHPLDL